MDDLDYAITVEAGRIGNASVAYRRRATGRRD